MGALKVWWATLFAALAVLVVVQSQAFRQSVPAAAVPAIAAAQEAGAAIAVNGSRAWVPPVQLTLSGDILGLATAGAPATVIVRAGNQAVSATVTGNGYSASIMAAPETMVRVEVDSVRVHYVSLLGSAALLKRRSGGDGRLVVGEHAMLRVSPTSTAIAFLSRHVLKGRDPLSDVELERAWRGLATGPGVSSNVASDLAAAAHVLAQAAQGALTLPPGFTTGYQLLQDAAAFKTTLDQNGIRSASLDYPFRTAEHVALGSLSQMPHQLLLMQRIPVLDIPTAPGATQLFIRKPTGRFDFQSSPVGPSLLGIVPAPSVNPEYDATILPTGDLLLIPVSGSVIETYAVETGARTYMTIRARKLRRLTQGERHDLWASWTQWEETYPDRPDLAAAVKTSVEIWSGTNLAEVAQPVSWGRQLQRVALPSVCMTPSTTAGAGEALRLCETVQHRFDPGGTGVSEDTGWKVDTYMQPKSGAWGGPFSWTLLDNQTQMRVINGAVTVDFWIIDEADASSDLILFKAHNQAGLPAGQTLVGVVLAVSGDYVPFSSAHAPGTWKLASSIYDPSYPEVFAPSFFVRHADGKADEYLEVNGLAGPSAPSNWLVTGERLYDSRYRARFGTSTRYVQNCTDAFASGATACSPSRIRYFRPLARSGRRIYGISDFYHQSSYYPPGYAGAYSVTRSGGGATYYDCTDGACLSYAPAQLSSSMPILAASAPPVPASTQPEKRPAHAHLRVPMRQLRPQFRPAAEAVRR